MKISVFGLGYVGTVITGCFAQDGHTVIGVDMDAAKVELVNQGRSPIIERDLDALIEAGVKAGRIRATTDYAAAVRETEMTMICVGTPSKPTGELDLTHVTRVSENIGSALKTKDAYHVVVARSTMLPGSVEGTLIPALERTSGKKFKADFGVAINPEFLREATAIHDFYHPPKTIIGAEQERDFDLVASLYRQLEAPMVHVPFKTAEMVKYTDNVYHALKITFGNEIGAICKKLGIDGREVMDLFCLDTKLNLSPAYFRPGFAYGGSCLPKDLRAITRLAHLQDIDIPLIKAIGVSNEQQIQNAVRRIMELGKRRIGVLGFAFKEGTDDLRESPIVSVVESLLGKGCDLKLYDSHVSLSKLIGANRRFIEQRIPHISRLMVESVDELAAHAELILLGNSNPECIQALARLTPSQLVIDLTPAMKQRPTTPAQYERWGG